MISQQRRKESLEANSMTKKPERNTEYDVDLHTIAKGNLASTLYYVYMRLLF